MCGTNLVVQKVNDPPWIQFVVGTIDGMQSALDKVVVVGGKVRNIDIRVLKPVKDTNRRRGEITNINDMTRVNPDRQRHTNKVNNMG